MLTDTYTDARDGKLTTLSGEMNGLPSDEAWEKVWVNILDVIIRYGKGLEMDETDREDLLAIAEGCPAEIGLATQAVIAYMPAADVDPFKVCEKAPAECEEERHSRSSDPTIPGSIFPNPANKHLTVLLQDTNTGGTWRIRSVSGNLINQGNWNNGESWLQIDLSAYNSGFYTFETESTYGHRSVKKFTIVK